MSPKPSATFAHTDTDGPLLIDLERLIGDGIMVQANAGGGKSGASLRT